MVRTRSNVTTLILVGFLLASLLLLAGMNMGHIWGTPSTQDGMGSSNFPKNDCGPNFTLFTFINGTWCTRGNLTQDEMQTILTDEGKSADDPDAVRAVLRVFEELWLNH